MNLSGNTILITGGSSGIGLALAKEFLTLKNEVIIVGRNINKLKEVKQNHPEVNIFQCDLVKQNGLIQLIEYIQKNHSQLNILINNAGIQYNYDFLDNEIDQSLKIEEEININLTSPIKLSALLLPLLMQKNSAIINVSSGLMITPKKSASVYCATKSAIHSFSTSLRYQLEETSVSVFEIIPPLVVTEMTKGRGGNKITPEDLVKEFIPKLKKDQFEIYIEKSKFLKIINRISPFLAQKIIKNN